MEAGTQAPPGPAALRTGAWPLGPCQRRGQEGKDRGRTGGARGEGWEGRRKTGVCVASAAIGLGAGRGAQPESRFP